MVESLTALYIGVLLMLFWGWVLVVCWRGIVRARWSLATPNEVRVQYGDRD